MVLTLELVMSIIPKLIFSRYYIMQKKVVNQLNDGIDPDKFLDCEIFHLMNSGNGKFYLEREIHEKKNHSFEVSLSRVSLEESRLTRGEIKKLLLLKTVYKQDKKEQLNKELKRREMLALAMSFRKLGR